MKNDNALSLKYRILRRLVKAANIKKRWTGMSAEALLENRRKQNAKNKIPDLSDDAFTIERIEVMGCPVLKMIHKQKTDKANLFLIGGGMISAPRPGSVKKALRFARETGLDVFVPYYPLCTEYPLTKAYEMVHETYRVMLRDYAPENISVLGTSSGGNLALGMIPYINDGHADTPAPHYIMAISPGTCVRTDEEWQRMLELDEKDVAIPAQYMKTAEEIMRHGDDSIPDYMGHLADLAPEAIVELGYGGGRNAKALLKRYPNAKLTAVDHSALSVEKTKEHNRDLIGAGRCTVLQGDVQSLPFADGSFDLATAFETVYFWPGLIPCFTEVCRVLRPGGTFLICNESDGTDETGLKFEKIIDGMKCHTVEALSSALKTAGFSNVAVDRYPNKPWITVLAEK